ncbi:hypothetical protein KIPB_011621, partial [Kipferlia bialata]|eukprot:g11621.t1
MPKKPPVMACEERGLEGERERETETEPEEEKKNGVSQSTFNLTNSVLGAGLLSLAYAMAQ